MRLCNPQIGWFSWGISTNDATGTISISTFARRRGKPRAAWNASRKRRRRAWEPRRMGTKRSPTFVAGLWFGITKWIIYFEYEYLWIIYYCSQRSLVQTFFSQRFPVGFTTVRHINFFFGSFDLQMPWHNELAASLCWWRTQRVMSNSIYK